MIEIDWNPSRRFLRQFSLLLVLFFAIVAAIVHFHYGSTQLAIALAVFGTVIGLTGFALPSFMRVVYVICTNPKHKQRQG